MMMEGVVT